MLDFTSIDQDLSGKVGDRIVNHRNEFYQMFIRRYAELLPLTIGYEGTTTKKVSIDPIQIEEILRNGYQVALGQTTKGVTMLLGTIKSTNNQIAPYYYNVLNEKDIEFFIPKELQLKHYTNITPFQDGNFIILRNKPLTYMSDFMVVRYYANELAEIVTSRYSLVMQSKILTFVRDDVGSEDASEIVNKLYNGIPYVKSSKQFDPEESILQWNGIDAISKLAELKREYQNKIAELNAMLGLNTLGVDKESGVSDAEAQSNKSFKKANENIYLTARNEPLALYNKKYGTNIHAEYRDQQVKELSSIERVNLIEDLTNGGENGENIVKAL